MLRWFATLGIAALLALDLLIPKTSLGRRGTEAAVRADVPSAAGAVGETFPAFTLQDLYGRPVSLSDFRGQRVLLTFERSVDW
jgi:cytochrome oxidase Cu insertion factor (SCO1/SenC/PrrC family)